MAQGSDKPGPFLGLDVGTRRIGVARADATTRIATPLKTVEAGPKKRAPDEIAQLILQDKAPIVVVGWPLTLEGEEGRAVARVERFIKRMLAAFDKLSEAAGADDNPLAAPQIIRWDERMTTTAAESFLIGQNVSRARRKKVVDQVAATHILQGYLDSLR